MGDRKVTLKEVPETITDQKDGTVYQRGRFLGKGGFARCYELIDTKANRVFAGKIVAKVLLQKKHQKDKMAQEVEIHKGLSHPHVVRLDGFFEDNDNVYILLELCARRSLMELHKRRKAVTEPEARYFTSQVVVACEYLHGKRIIHRDLKLGNLFLNEEMIVKIGDFGLATTVDFDGEKKKTLCGTPNYIAPEMLGKKGHSYEVDIWAIGCIMYTLLVGKPPFETHSLKETYQKIKNNDYVIPSRVSADAANLIELLLADDPSKRPTIQQVRKSAFFTRGFLPSRLPTSCLTMAPKFTSVNMSTCESDRRVLSELGQQPMSPFKRDTVASPLRPLAPIVESQAMGPAAPAEAEGNLSVINVPSDCYLSDLHSQLNLLISKKPADRDQIQEEEAEDPAAVPVFWVSKWVDYSDKYGLGYELCDNSLGVVFNDNTKMVMDAAGEQFQYIDRENKETFFTVNEHPRGLQKKVTLLSYFRNYMQEHLQKTGGNMVREGDELARLPVLRTWFRTRSAIVLHLSNGTMQINFFQDHTKLIVCPLMSAATYIDRHRKFRVFKFDLIEKFGCSRDVYARLKYARSMVERLMAEPAHARPGALSTVAIPGGNFGQVPYPNFP